MKKILKFILSLIICQAAAAAGALVTAPAIDNWYLALDKPGFTPSGSFIGAVWTVLYVLMSISLYLVWARDWQVRQISSAKTLRAWNRFSQELYAGSWQKKNIILIFCAQLVLNILWSVIFFGFEEPGWAFFELAALWMAILYTIINFYRVSRPAAYLLLPYIFWVTFAGYLNFTIWQMN